MRFCEKHNPTEDDSEEWVISYETLLELGHEAFEEPDGDEFGFSCGNNMTMCDALRADGRDFWINWSIVTGVPLPPDYEEKSFFRCAC